MPLGGCTSSESSSSKSLELSVVDSSQSQKDGEIPALNAWHTEKDRILGFESEQDLNEYLASAQKQKLSETTTKITTRTYNDVLVSPMPDMAIFYSNESSAKTYRETRFAPWKAEGKDLIVPDQYPVMVSWKNEMTGDTGYSYDFSQEKGASRQVYCVLDELQIELYKVEFHAKDSNEAAFSAWHAVPVNTPVSASLRPAQTTLIP